MIMTLLMIGWISFPSLMLILFPTFAYLMPVYLIGGLFSGLLLIALAIISMMPFGRWTSYTNRAKTYFVKSVSYFLNIFLWNLEITEVDAQNIPLNNPKLTVYANHKSHSDVFVLLEKISGPVAFTPKGSLYNVPILSFWMKNIGCMKVDRTSNRNTARAMIKTIKDIKEGLTMTIFPEGGILDKDDDQMATSRAGAYQIAKKSGADILPVSLIGASGVEKQGIFRKTSVKVIYHPLILYESYQHLSTAEIADLVSNIINEGIIGEESSQ